MQRVGEAQRLAAMDMREKETKKRSGGKRMREMGDEDAADPDLQRMMDQAGKKRAGGKGGGKGGGKRGK